MRNRTRYNWRKGVWSLEPGAWSLEPGAWRLGKDIHGDQRFVQLFQRLHRHNQEIEYEVASTHFALHATDLVVPNLRHRNVGYLFRHRNVGYHLVYLLVLLLRSPPDTRPTRPHM
jgi:hypothetical protein